MKQIMNAYLVNFQFSKFNVKIDFSNLVIQFDDLIMVRSLKQDYHFAITKYLAPLSMVMIKPQSYAEFLYITNERDGSKIRMLSFYEGTNDVTRTVYKQPGVKIRSFFKRADKVFIIDDNLEVRTFTFTYKEWDKRFSEVTQGPHLEVSETTKESMNENRDLIFKPFHRAHISANYGLHIANIFYQFHESASKAASYGAAQDMTWINKEIDPLERSFLRGPFDFQDDRDNLAYYY